MTRQSSICPLCPQPSGSLYHPFCSKRCQWVDLGHWLDEQYRIPSVDNDADQDAGDDELEHDI